MYLYIVYHLNNLPVLSSFMTYHLVCNQINTTGATRGTGTAYPSRLSSAAVLVGFVLLDLQFMCMICRSFFVLFLLAIVLSVFPRFMDSDYPFGIFKLFLEKANGRSHLELIIQRHRQHWAQGTDRKQPKQSNTPHKIKAMNNTNPNKYQE